MYYELLIKHIHSATEHPTFQTRFKWVKHAFEPNHPTLSAQNICGKNKTISFRMYK